MNIIFVDATEPGLLGLSWRVGARLLSPFFDKVHFVRHPVDVRDRLREHAENNDWLDNIQFWGHGAPGRFLIDDQPLYPSDFESLRYHGTRLWFRSCDTLRGKKGIAFAQSLSGMGISVAGHLTKIGYWGCQSYLVGCMAGMHPWWPEEFNGVTSAPWLPRTVLATRISPDLPDWIWGPGNGVPRALPSWRG